VKIKLDENIPVSLLQVLASHGHDVHTVWNEGLAGKKDEEIWIRCQQEERLLITQDLDFADLRKFQSGSHFGIILVRLQHPGRIELLNLLSYGLRSPRRGELGWLLSDRLRNQDPDSAKLTKFMRLSRVHSIISVSGADGEPMELQ
jgi:predicted nuclease of predicted toxin-antitoxin system